MAPFSVNITEAEEGEGPIHRSALCPEELTKTPDKEVETLFDVFAYASNKFEDNHGFGYRTVQDTIKTTKKVTKVINGKETTVEKAWTYFQLSDYNYYTYREAFDIVKAIGFGLTHLGYKKNDKLQIAASTSAEWIFMAHGAFSQGITIVTAYDTLGSEGLQHSISESEASLLFINTEQLPTLQKILTACPSIHTIIYRGDPVTPETVNQLRSHDPIQHVLSFQALIDLGKSNPSQVRTPSSGDLCCIMYTSGSTGNPKGVMITHGNVVAAIAGISRMLSPLLKPSDSMIAYLPLAHVLEFVVEHVCLFLGVTLGYGSVRTLTNGSVKHCVGDLQAFQPTLMTGVPQVWESIKKTVLAEISDRGSHVQRIFSGAFWFKKYLADHHLPSGLLNTIVFDHIKKQVGGKLRYCISAGAPVSPETQEFLTVAVSPLLVVYGMTESCGMCTLMHPDQYATNEVGSPVPCVEVKLVDQPELGYVTEGSDHPQGEVWIRGPSIASGYYKRQEITRDTFTTDGWLKTGDIGEWTERGTLRIIDRIKNLVKLSNGEYIALEKLESVYLSCHLLENVLVYANPLYEKPVALVVPLKKPFRKFLGEHGMDQEQDWQSLCESRETRALVLKTLQDYARNGGLKGTEIISNLWTCKDTWTAEKGLLTAAQKLKRKEIHQTYEKELKDMLQ